MNVRIALRAGFAILLLSGCRVQPLATSRTPPPSPRPSVVAVMSFGIPVGMLPVNVVGSYGGGNASARRMGAGKHPLPSGVGIPVGGSSPKQSVWTCMVLLYGDGAAVKYEGMGHCGIGKAPDAKKNALCEIPLPKEDPAQIKGKVTTGWCMPDKRPKLSQK